VLSCVVQSSEGITCGEEVGDGVGINTLVAGCTDDWVFLLATVTVGIKNWSWEGAGVVGLAGVGVGGVGVTVGGVFTTWVMTGLGLIGEILLLLPAEDIWICADGVDEVDVVVVLPTPERITDGLFDPKLLATETGTATGVAAGLTVSN